VIAISRQAKDGIRAGLNNRDARWLRRRGERPRGEYVSVSMRNAALR
jgi:hypothetical protein